MPFVSEVSKATSPLPAISHKESEDIHQLLEDTTFGFQMKGRSSRPGEEKMMSLED